MILLGGEHRTDCATTYPFSVTWGKKNGKHINNGTTKGDVIIGNDVWIGTDAIIMSGVTIGDGAVIGARSLVIKDVPPYTIYAGSPARFIRKRFDDETIRRLMEIKYWDWTEEKIEQMLPLLLSPDVHAFIVAAENWSPSSEAKA